MQEPVHQTRWYIRLLWMTVNLAGILIFAALAPLEKTLGANIRLVYLHGAWVWTGLIAFGLSGLIGLLAFISRKQSFFSWTTALGRTGLSFWLTYLPMSLMVMQMNWGGFYFDEPRWRIPMVYAVVGILLQVGLWLVQTRWITAVGNLIFAAALWWSTINMRSILHPDSPVLRSESVLIRVYFLGLLISLLILAFQLAVWCKQRQKTARLS